MCALVIDTSIALRPEVRLWVHLWAFWQWWARVVDRVVGAYCAYSARRQSRLLCRWSVSVKDD